MPFATEKDAQAFINAHLDCCTTYELRHGEYAPPGFTPRRYKDGWGVHAEYHYYAGTFYAPVSGRVPPEELSRFAWEASGRKTMLNLTQHPSTPEQGVTDLSGEALAVLKAALTFDALPTAQEIIKRAEAIAELAAEHGARSAMIGGAPYLMAPLENALKVRGITPMYAFSVRESAEQTLPDGTVRKVNSFRHAGFVQS